MSTPDALDPFNGLATTGASTSSGVPDFVKKLYRQVFLTKKNVTLAQPQPREPMLFVIRAYIVRLTCLLYG